MEKKDHGWESFMSQMFPSPHPTVLEPDVLTDERGHFFEAWNSARFRARVEDEFVFVQDNQSRSRKGVLRGLHYQSHPMEQGKLVRVVRGAVFDVAVDIRRSSASFGEWFGVELSDENFKQLWIPPGFAHGFLALADQTDLLYKVTEYHSPDHDRAIRWDDPDIGIEWPLDGEPIVSDRDATAPYLRDAKVLP